MAVDAIKERITSKTSHLNSNKSGEQSEYTNMTAQEIVDAYNNDGMAFPKDVIDWAQETVKSDPNSTVTYGESQKNSETMSPKDAVSYIQAMQEEGMSLKSMCKEMTDLSKEMEERDLQNVSKMAPFMPEMEEGQQTGDKDESEVSKLMNELTKDANKDAKSSPFKKSQFREDVRFFGALKGTDGAEVDGVEVNLEDMESVLNETDADSKQSKEYGNATVDLGKSLKGHSSGLLKIMAGIGVGILVSNPLVALAGGLFGGLFGSGRRKIANNAIDQGNKTVKTGDKTNRLANALAIDNSIVLKSVIENSQNIDGSSVPEGSSGGESSGGSSDSGASSGVSASTASTGASSGSSSGGSSSGSSAA